MRARFTQENTHFKNIASLKQTSKKNLVEVEKVWKILKILRLIKKIFIIYINNIKEVYIFGKKKNTSFKNSFAIKNQLRNDWVTNGQILQS